jgi:hypothetical protein
MIHKEQHTMNDIKTIKSLIRVIRTGLEAAQAVREEQGETFTSFEQFITEHNPDEALLLDALVCRLGELEREERRADEQEGARLQAAAQMSSIVEMVEALNCDYERLEELKEEREELQEALQEAMEEDPVVAGSDECLTLIDAEEALYQFGRENAEELAELEAAAGDHEDRDEAERRIQEDPLEVQVRTGWYTPGIARKDLAPAEFTILLCTGGPAVRIVGELDQYQQPVCAQLEYQDWFTPWVKYHGVNFDHDALLTYCQQFYFEA